METVQAWNYYNPQVKAKPLIRRCRIALAEALEQLGLNHDALNLCRRLAADGPATETLTLNRLELQRARLLSKGTEPLKAIAVLEGLPKKTRDPQQIRMAYEQLAQAYEAAGQPLQAAQAWQMLTQLPETDGSARRRALLRAGQIFLDQEMPVQTIELGLKGLIEERQLLEQNVEDEASRTEGNALRLMLARAYEARRDDAREVIILEDYLTREGIPNLEQALARLMLGDSLRRLGRREDAGRIYQTAAKDKSTPEPWRSTARQQLTLLEWNRDHPHWRVEQAGDKWQ